MHFLSWRYEKGTMKPAPVRGIDTSQRTFHSVGHINFCAVFHENIFSSEKNQVTHFLLDLILDSFSDFHCVYSLYLVFYYKM